MNYADVIAQIQQQTTVQGITQAKQRCELRVLGSSVDGTVQQLSIHTIGGVVTPAEQLMVVRKTLILKTKRVLRTGTLASCIKGRKQRSKSKHSHSPVTASFMARS